MSHRVVLGGEPLQIAWRHEQQLAGIAYGPAADVDNAALVDDLAAAFGLGTHQLSDWQAINWTDQPSIGGSYILFGPGDITHHAPKLAARQGRLHFAAAERSSWPMFMEGAVESGARAAYAVLATML